MISIEDFYALNMIKGLGPAKLKGLSNTYDDINDITTAKEKELGKIIKGPGKDKIIFEIKNEFELYREKAEYELREFEENELRVISQWDEEYPNSLKVIKKPPTFLFCRGNIKLLKEERSIAVIGTRNPTDGGYNIGYSTAKYFSSKDYNIVSGLALGIDTSAHIAAIDLKNKTTAVLVTIDNIYPKENQDLADTIIENGGLLLAENKPGTPIQGPLFVERDRLQSALSKAVFPIETDIKGGTLHTVRFAETQKKKVYCPRLKEERLYKSHIGNPMSKGIDMLLNSNRAIPYNLSDLEEVFTKVEQLKIKGDINNLKITSNVIQESFAF